MKNAQYVIPAGIAGAVDREANPEAKDGKL
jgi:hypothetical protein